MQQVQKSIWITKYNILSLLVSRDPTTVAKGLRTFEQHWVCGEKGRAGGYVPADGVYVERMVLMSRVKQNSDVIDSNM